MRDREMTRSVGGGSAQRATVSAAVGPADTGTMPATGATRAAVRTWLSLESADRGGAVGSGLPGRAGEPHSQPLGSPGLIAFAWDTQHDRGASSATGCVPQQGQTGAASTFGTTSPPTGPAATGA